MGEFLVWESQRPWEPLKALVRGLGGPESLDTEEALDLPRLP